MGDPVILHLVTGANGAGKTLNTLKWVRERQLKENRAVYYNGRFEMVADFGWLKFDFKDWQDLPDGAIIIVDECHNDLPVRGSSAPVPEPVRMLAEHRRRGFDFYLITQHPQNLDLFVRRLIGSPGWHRHLKRTFGADLVSCLEWSAVNGNCEKAGAGKDAKVSMIAFPKEVYAWYKSASLHTGKKAVPKQVYVLVALAILIPVMIWFAYQSLMRPAKAITDKTPAAAAVQPGYTPRQEEKRSMTRAEYVQSFQPRFEGLPQTAPRYDEINKAQQAPKPAACLDGRKPGAKARTCQCWTQQATPLQVPADLCRQIAAGGFFDDSLRPQERPDQGRVAEAPRASAADVQGASPVSIFNAGLVLPPPDTRSTVSRDAETLAFMAKRRQMQ
ncbi:zonular occludens toxin domain-containing protein [Polaromonas sp.]|uniref:zonular occludens toxin domain-containing protein n=1 Tax=Polaromonas sp. TaxID=1869339 RepID=UPI0032654FF3